jgi:hypothetical protein
MNHSGSGWKLLCQFQAAKIAAFLIVIQLGLASTAALVAAMIRLISSLP